MATKAVKGEHTMGNTQAKALSVGEVIRVRIGPRHGRGGTRIIDLDAREAAQLMEQLARAISRNLSKATKQAK